MFGISCLSSGRGGQHPDTDRNGSQKLALVLWSRSVGLEVAPLCNTGIDRAPHSMPSRS